MVPILMCAGPISLTLAIENGETMVNLYFVGIYDDENDLKGRALGGVGIGNMWTNTMGIVAILAFDAGLQIFCSYAHGRNNPKMVGIFYQRGIAILACVLSVMTVLMLLTKPIMLAVGFKEHIVYYSY